MKNGMDEERLKNRKRRARKALLRTAAVLLAVGAVVFAFKAPVFDVDNYEINGNSYYGDSEIMVMGNCRTGGNIFIGTDLKDIEDRLKKDAYTESVTIRRKLPSTISIDIIERHQQAALVYGEKLLIIDQNGIALRKAIAETQLPVIKGVKITKLEIGEPVEVEEKVQLRQALEIISSMEKNDMYFVAVEIVNAEVKASILDNLVCSGTPESIMTNLENGTIQAVTEELFKRGIERGTIKVTDSNYVSYSPDLS